MYAFECSDARVLALNEYFDGSSDTGANGDVIYATFAWLSGDLSTTTKLFIFEMGRDPAYIFPDIASRRVRHERGGLEVNPAHRHRFWRLLKDRRLTAHICGRTHRASPKKAERVWQLKTGHARGKGDRGAPTTFAKITVGHGDPGTSTTGPTPGASATRSRCPARSSRSSAAPTRPHRL